MKIDPPICQIENCGKPHHAKQLCMYHYVRAYKTGKLEVKPKRKQGTGSVRDTGYIRLTRCKHPLADTSGMVFEHRAVLYDAIGEGTHTCHWCPTQLTWMTNGNPRTPGYLTVDHLDWNKQNNQLDNLVPSCLKCNAERQLKAQSK